MESFRKKLRKFKRFEELEELARNLFQKDKQLTSELTKFIADIGGKNSSHELRHFIMMKVENILEQRPRNLPDRLESYVSFSDLSYVIRHSNERVWHTFCLKDYKKDIHTLGAEQFVGARHLRKCVKNAINRITPDQTASVQQDVRLTESEMSDADRAEIIFLRIVTAAAKSSKVIEKRLCTKKATYIVYFPGEPYLYTDSNHADLTHLQAVTEALHASGFSSISLVGRKVEDLRRMRVIKDKKKSGDDMDVDGDEMLAALKSSPPQLENFTLKYVSATPQEDITVSFNGSNVLSGLASFESSKVFGNQPPVWASQALTRGRNTIKVVERSDENGNGDVTKFQSTQVQRDDVDAMSDVTAL